MQNKFIIGIFLILVGATSLRAQSQHSPFQEENIFYAGKIWGFVKYYHPEARVGKFDMDSLLVVLLDNVAEAKDLKQRNAVFNNWVAQFGKINTFEPLVIKDSSQYKQLYDYSWLTNKTFDKKLTKQLSDIKNAKRTDSCYYAKLDVIKVPSFENETSITPNFEKKYQKLLPLMRYWNVIEYYFPYKYLTDKKWDDVLKEYIPLFLSAGAAANLNTYTQHLITETNDGHSYFDTSKVPINLPYKKYMSPVKLIYSKDRYIVKGLLPYVKTTDNIRDYGFEVGDEIIKVNNRDPNESMVTDYSKYLSASNLNYLYNSFSSIVLQSDTTFIDVSYKRNGVLMNDRIKIGALTYRNTNTEPKENFWITPDSIAYLHVGGITADEVYDILHKTRKTKGMVIDMRNYRSNSPIDLIANNLSYYSLRFVRGTGVVAKYPGMFKYVSDNNEYTGNNNSYYKKKVVVIVDHTNISEAEFTTMRLQYTPYVTTIGSQTAGADGNVSYIPLQQGVEVYFSSLGIYYPDGSETQRVGIQLDEEVYPTPQGIREGRDEQLDRALEIIRTEKKKVNKRYIEAYTNALKQIH